MALDCFQILEIPRQPWIDDAQLKDHFHRLAAIHHPDTSSGSTSAFSELNTAWQTLREPATCLRHFLSLEHPGVLAIAERTPTDLGDLFMEIADAPAVRAKSHRPTQRRSHARPRAHGK